MLGDEATLDKQGEASLKGLAFAACLFSNDCSVNGAALTHNAEDVRQLEAQRSADVFEGSG